jgi:hypothetical protein
MAEKKNGGVKDIKKIIFNPVSLGTLYFSFALSLWSSKQIDDPQIKGITIFLTVISVIFFISVYSKWVVKIVNKVVKWLTLLTFIGFVYGFAIGWLQSLSGVSGAVLDFIVYFGFAWFVTILLVEVKEVQSKFLRISGSILVAIALVWIAITKYVNSDNIAGGVLVVIALLVILVATNVLKLQGSVFEQ